jgi:hypothetical protein
MSKFGCYSPEELKNLSKLRKAELEQRLQVGNLNINNPVGFSLDMGLNSLPNSRNLFGKKSKNFFKNSMYVGIVISLGVSALYSTDVFSQKYDSSYSQTQNTQTQTYKP